MKHLLLCTLIITVPCHGTSQSHEPAPIYEQIIEITKQTWAIKAKLEECTKEITKKETLGVDRKKVFDDHKHDINFQLEQVSQSCRKAEAIVYTNQETEKSVDLQHNLERAKLYLNKAQIQKQILLIALQILPAKEKLEALNNTVSRFELFCSLKKKAFDWHNSDITEKLIRIEELCRQAKMIVYADQEKEKCNELLATIKQADIVLKQAQEELEHYENNFNNYLRKIETCNKVH